MLFGRRKQSLSGWLEQAQVFYANITNDDAMINALTEYGYTAAKLKDEFDFLNQVIAKNDNQKRETGEAQAATQARDKKLDELAKWVSDLRAVAKVALAEDLQQLEKLGILARTSKATRSQKPAEESQSTETK